MTETPADNRQSSCAILELHRGTALDSRSRPDRVRRSVQENVRGARVAQGTRLCADHHQPNCERYTKQPNPRSDQFWPPRYFKQTATPTLSRVNAISLLRQPDGSRPIAST